MSQINDSDKIKSYSGEKREEFQKAKLSKVKDAKISKDPEILKRLHNMILYAIGRHDWYDNLRFRFLIIGLALIGASAALATFVVKITPDLPLLIDICAFLFILIIFITGLLLIWHYNSHIAQNYPYRNVADIRSWYFIYTFHTKMIDQLSKKFTEAKTQIDDVVENFEKFIDRWLEYAKDMDCFIAEDLEQVTILQLLQRYRYQAVKTMSKILTRGIILAGISLSPILLFYLINLIFNSNP